MEKGLNQLVGKQSPGLTHNLDLLLNLNNGEVAAVVLYNSLGWNRTEFVQIPLNRQDVQILDFSGKVVPFQVKIIF